MAKRLFGLVFVLALAAAGARASAQGAPLVIGAVVSQTGAHADLAEPYRRALVLWQEQANAKGGVLGRPVELKILDDRSEAVRAGRMYAELIREQKVDALIGPYGTAATMTAAAEAESAKRVLINGAGWSRAVHKRAPRFVFQSCAPYSAYATGVLAIAKEQGYRRLAVLARDEVAAREMAASAVEAASAAGLTAGDVVVYPGNTSDFAPLVEKARIGEPHAWLVFGELRDAAELVKAMKNAAYAPQLFFARSASDPKLAELIGQDAELALGASEYDPRFSTPGNKEFVAAFTARWGSAPTAAAAEGWAAATVLAEGLKRAGSADPAKLRAAIAELALTTVLGPFRVDPATGAQTATAPAVTQILLGRPQIVWPDALATAKRVLPYPQWSDREYLK